MKYFKETNEKISHLGEDTMWLRVERFGSEVNLVLVSACFTRLPFKLIIALKYTVTLNNLKMTIFNYF